MKKVLIVLSLVFIGVLLGVFLFTEHKENFNQVYETESIKNLAQIIENSISEISIKSEKEFNSSLNNLYLDMNLKGIEGICSIGSFNSTQKILNSNGIDWRYADLWDYKKDSEWGGLDGAAGDLLLIKKDRTIIPIAYIYDSTIVTGNLKLANLTAPFCIKIKNPYIKIKIQSLPNKKITEIKIDN